MATPALARHYNISTTAVKRPLYINGVPLRRYHRLSEADARTAAELYQGGWRWPSSAGSLTSTAIRCGVGSYGLVCHSEDS